MDRVGKRCAVPKWVIGIVVAVTMALSPVAVFAHEHVRGMTEEYMRELAGKPVDPADIPRDLREVNEYTTGKCGDNLTWTFVDGTLTVSGTGSMYSCEDEDIFGPRPLIEGYVLPDCWSWGEVSNYVDTIVLEDGITTIGDNAFCDMPRVTSIEIPDSVTHIGINAFADDYGLTSVKLPNSACEMDALVFEGCGDLRELTIPAGTFTTPDAAEAANESLYKGVFVNLFEFGTFAQSGITDVTLAEGTETIPSAFFQGCKTLQRISLPRSLKNIDAYAFAGCMNLEELDIPEGVVSLGRDAFWYCTALKRITIPSSVRMLDNGLFSQNDLSGNGYEYPPATYRDDLVVSGYINSCFDAWRHSGNYVPGTFRSLGELEPSVYAEGTFEGGTTWSMNTLLDLTIGGTGEVSGEAISRNEFFSFEWDADYAKTLTIQQGVTSIGAEAFSGLDRITSIRIPEGVATLGIGAFEDCAELACVSLPASLQSVGEEAFVGCGKLADVYYAGSPSMWENVDVHWRNNELDAAQMHFALEDDQTDAPSQPVTPGDEGVDQPSGGETPGGGSGSDVEKPGDGDQPGGGNQPGDDAPSRPDQPGEPDEPSGDEQPGQSSGSHQAAVTFTDVTDATPHAGDIRWLAESGISTGWRNDDGTYHYSGMSNVVRQDMAAFLHRLYEKGLVG